MDQNFDIGTYMAKGIEHIVSDALRATLKNPKESIFMTQFALSAKKATAKRAKSDAEGEHIPPFLITSITSSCNLHCAGCYSRCNEATVDTEPVKQLTSDEWGEIFDQATELGVSFILLAGGEPLLRRDVIEAAGKRRDILFPVFTNGTFINDRYFELFDNCRNLIPVLSIEGDREVTDARRGEGVYDKLISVMDELGRRDLIFGASITVTTENIRDISSRDFIKTLYDRGCKLAVFVEFVPVTEDSKHLAPQDADREYLKSEIRELRELYPDMIFLSFPGDEKATGGCIAAGRGFFHINSHGGAEPCPFSPYSDINVLDTSLRDAIHSKLFTALRDGDVLADDHDGGCVLYEKRDIVEALLSHN